MEFATRKQYFETFWRWPALCLYEGALFNCNVERVFTQIAIRNFPFTVN